MIWHNRFYVEDTLSEVERLTTKGHKDLTVTAHFINQEVWERLWLKLAMVIPNVRIKVQRHCAPENIRLERAKVEA